MGKRHLIQALWALITNIRLDGFLNGQIYSGKLKSVCVPGLNCYSCPGALGACPIGSLQAVLGKGGRFFSFYVVGFLIAIGALLGRFVCGFLCPFGLIQELLFKIPFIKKINTFYGDRILRKLKYIILAVFVIILPMVITDVIGQGKPFFCEYICPAGTLEAGIPLLIADPFLRGAIGHLFELKVTILIITIIAAIIIYRPFCKYICPLGAVYSIFNPIAILRLKVDRESCTSCGSCSKVCNMGLNPSKECNHAECVRCMACMKTCKNNAISSGVNRDRNSKLMNA